MLSALRSARLAYARSERGQILVLFVAIFSVILAIAAFSIDQGLFYNKRRIAQKDADSASRAAVAQFIPAIQSGAAYSTRFTQVINTANAMASQNGADTPLPITNPSTNCPTLTGSIANAPSIEVAVRRPSPAFLLPFFGGSGAGDNIGAPATSCIGSVVMIQPGPTDVIPLALHYDSFAGGINGCFDETTPRFGQNCTIAFKFQSILTLPASGACQGGSVNPNQIEVAIETGMNATNFRCTINGCTVSGPPDFQCGGNPCSGGARTDCVDVRNGALGINDVDAFQERIQNNQGCSTSGNNLTNFRATFDRADGQTNGGPPGLGGTDPAGTIYVQRACDSGRVALVFIVDEVDCTVNCANDEEPIKGYALVYITGCNNDTPSTDVNPLQSPNGINDCSGNGSIGNVSIQGVLLRVQLTDSTAGDIGTITTQSPLAIQTTR